MNVEYATWIAALPQWNLLWMGLTNSVQPYCRLAFITMQMMPTVNCTHRLRTPLVAEYDLAAAAGSGASPPTSSQMRVPRVSRTNKEPITKVTAATVIG